MYRTEVYVTQDRLDERRPARVPDDRARVAGHPFLGRVGGRAAARPPAHARRSTRVADGRWLAGCMTIGIGAGEDTMSIIPFTVDVPQPTLDDLHSRLERTRWTDDIDDGW